MLLDPQTLDVLHSVYLAPRTIQSDFARQWAYEVALLASRGHITTQTSGEKYGRQWRTTQTGLAVLATHGFL